MSVFLGLNFQIEVLPLGFEFLDPQFGGIEACLSAGRLGFKHLAFGFDMFQFRLNTVNLFVPVLKN